MHYLDKLEQIRTRQDFVGFLGALIHDLKTNPQDWENPGLDRYLDAAMSWTEDMDGYYMNIGEPMPQDINWKVFAEILAAAVIYE